MSELTSSFALTLQIQRIIARSFRRIWFIVAAVIAQVSAACSITLLTHVEYTRPLVRRGRLRLVRRRSNIGETCPKHICSVLQQPARNHRQQRACLLNGKTLGQPQVFHLQPPPLLSFFHQKSLLYSGIGRS